MKTAIVPSFAAAASVDDASEEQNTASGVSVSKQEVEILLSEKLDEVADVLDDGNAGYHATCGIGRQ